VINDGLGTRFGFFCVQLVAGGCWLVAVSVGGSPLAQPGGYGHQPKCRTEYETTYKTTYETIYKPKCQTTYEQVGIYPKAAILTLKMLTGSRL